MDTGVEILAPAGSEAALIAAVENGAHAVYLGGKRFSARQYANNFDDQQLRAAVSLCHRAGVKLYVTVNTILNDNELPEALDYLYFLGKIGVDAVIIQDLGLMRAAYRHLPELELHGSTQMAVHNAAGVEFVRRFGGVDRVVLARELSLEDISSMRNQTEVGLEVFIHGALCISYSGQCLMSSMIGGRSGNRGRCAQPCRLPYQLVEQGSSRAFAEDVGQFLLSTRDLRTIEILPQLLAIGVRALKFEGRMKRPEYVAVVTRIYRQALDRCLENPEEFQAYPEEIRDLAQIFNREFTTGYFEGVPGAELMSFKRPNNRGIFLGRVKKVFKGKATIQLEEKFGVGDGIEFWVTRGGRNGMTVEKIYFQGQTVSQADAGTSIEIDVPPGISAGDRIFKTNDLQLITGAFESFISEEGKLKTPLKFAVRGVPGQPLSVTARDDTGREVTAATDFLAEKAQKHPLNQETLEKQLGRLGNTNYRLESLESDLEGELMVPLSELNTVRRKIIEALDYIPDGPDLNLLRLCAFKVDFPRLTVEVGDLESVKQAVLQGADVVYLGTEFRTKDWTISRMSEAIGYCRSAGVQVMSVLPRLVHPEEERAFRRKLENLFEAEPNGFVVGNPGTLEAVRETARNMVLFGDFGLNVFNHQAVELMFEAGLKQICLSPELNFKQLEQVIPASPLRTECLVYGALPLMVSRYCAVGSVAGGKTRDTECSKPCNRVRFGLKDRKNLVFPLNLGRDCRMHVFNPKVLNLLEDLPRFVKLGVGSLRLHMTPDSPREVRERTAQFRKALDLVLSGNDTKLDALIQSEKAVAGHYTKGHYYRGVE